MSKKKIIFEKNTIIKFFNDKKFKKISKYSNNIIDYYENDIDICKLVIASEINLKNYFKAEQFLKKVINIHNTDELNYLYGNILKIQNKYHEAIDLFKKAITINNKFSEAYNNLANTQKKIGDNENAKNNYIQAIKSNKSNFGAFFNLANLYRSEKKFEKAIDNYKKVLELKPQFVESMNNIGSINLILGNFENGIKYFKEAMNGAYKALDKLRSEKVIKAIGAGLNDSGMCARFSKEGDFDCMVLAGRYTLLEQGALHDFFPIAEEKKIGIILAGVFNSGILIKGITKNSTYDYGKIPEKIAKKYLKIDAICNKFNIPIAAAALQFCNANNLISTMILGMDRVEQINQNINLLNFKIDSEFWVELKKNKLIDSLSTTP